MPKKRMNLEDTFTNIERDIHRAVSRIDLMVRGEKELPDEARKTLIEFASRIRGCEDACWPTYNIVKGYLPHKTED